MQRQQQRQEVYRTFPAKHNKLQMQMKANDGKEQGEKEKWGKSGENRVSAVEAMATLENRLFHTRYAKGRRV